MRMYICLLFYDYAHIIVHFLIMRKYKQAAISDYAHINATYILFLTLNIPSGN